MNPPCGMCGEPATMEVTGRAPRIALLKDAYIQAAVVELRIVHESAILDLYREPEQWRCAAHAVCGMCFLVETDLKPCSLCSGIACPSCSLDAAMRDDEGALHPSSDGSILCCRCNPPSGADPAEVIGPPPVPSLELVEVA